MTTTTSGRTTTFATTIVWVLAVTALWLVVALLRPGTTLHLGPLLVPLVPLVIARGEPHAMRSTLLASGIALLATLALLVTGNLDGPALSPFPNAFVESLVLLGAGTAIGVVGISSAR
jgi:hypothetical protein